MCGIFALLNATGDDATLRRLVVELASRIRHRGPDWSSVWTDGKKNFLAHERLAIMDPNEAADQPMHNADGTISWVVNGEIYNFEKLRDEHGLDCKTTSDSEVVGLLYEKYGTSFVEMLDGMFVFTIVDSRGEEPVFMAGRDHMGISPLYIGYGEDDSTYLHEQPRTNAGEQHGGAQQLACPHSAALVLPLILRGIDPSVTGRRRPPDEYANRTSAPPRTSEPTLLL